MEELKALVRTLVDEFFDSGDLAEAVRCVQELDAPDFAHEVNPEPCTLNPQPSILNPQPCTLNPAP